MKNFYFLSPSQPRRFYNLYHDDILNIQLLIFSVKKKPVRRNLIGLVMLKRRQIIKMILQMMKITRLVSVLFFFLTSCCISANGNGKWLAYKMMINGKVAKVVLWQISIQQVGGGGEGIGEDDDKVVGEYYGELRKCSEFMILCCCLGGFGNR